MKLTPSAVKQLALARGLPVDQPDRLRTEAQRAALAASQPDVLVVAAYGLILPPEVLTLPRLGCLNIHASLLPRWRGAAPIHRAIQAGDAETGITIMQMDAGLDTGPMLLRQTLKIAPDDTTANLHDKLARLGATAIVDTLARLSDAPLPAEPQPDDGVTYAHKITRAEAELDWRRPAPELERAVRAFNPFPVAFGQLRDTTIKLWAAQAVAERGEAGRILRADASGVVVACGEGALCITTLQRPGSRRMTAAEFLHGFALTAGDRFALPAE
jgi:methionyl-tRNA formyltransferase